MKFNKRKVSPVIAVLIVATVVVLAAVLYVMLMDRSHPEVIPVAPLGLNQENKTISSSITMKIWSAPNGATTEGASISYIHDGTQIPVTAKLYEPEGNLVATYSTSSAFSETVPLVNGMTLVVTPASGSVSDGDVITITSNQHTFATSTLNITMIHITTPLGLNQQSKTSSTVNILISSAPNGATTEGASISYIHDGTQIPVTAKLYEPEGDLVATYGAYGFSAPVTLTSGMTLVITPSSNSVSAGDVITISSSQNTFSTSTLHVS